MTEESKPAAAPARGQTAIRVGAVFAVMFGVFTLREGGAVIMGDPAALEAAGNYVPFVVWFNFLAGFAYVAGGVGFWMEKPWATKLALGLAAATLLVFAAFGLHIATGGAFEERTVIAMTLRSGFWCLLAWLGARRGPTAQRAG